MSHPVDSAVNTVFGYYRDRCGLPVSIDPCSGRLVVRAGAIAAITTPEALGQRVSSSLRAVGVEPGPVIVHTRSRRWTFLLEPDIAFDDYELYAEMYCRSVTLAPMGASVALPVPGDPGDSYRSWKQVPAGAFRPSAALVIQHVRNERA